MIERYSLPEMSAIWADNNKLTTIFNIELAVTDALEERNIVPKGLAAKLRSLVTSDFTFDLTRIREIEQETKHDIIAFLTYLGELIGATEAKFLHYGLTSSDVGDTCLALQLKQSGEILAQNLYTLIQSLKEKAQLYKYTNIIGRTHGMHAEPTTLGLVIARWYSEMQRNLARLHSAIKDVSICKLSGAVGNFSHLGPEIEDQVAKSLQLEPELVASQVIPRDRHAFFFSILAIIASSIEHIVVNIRHFQRTEVGELFEPFEAGQKGSSAMPHKRNPILSENLTGLARLIRSYAAPALENIALWHERDISHSSVERCIAPDACILLNFALVRLNGIISGLGADEERMTKNLALNKDMMLSQRVLLALVSRGFSREEAYKIAQDSAKLVWKNSSNFLIELKQHPHLLESPLFAHPSELEEFIDSFTDLSYFNKHVDEIFGRVFHSN